MLLAAILLGVVLLRWRLLDVPLERDEGEYAYLGQLLLQGEPPYGEAYNMKLPGIYAVYAAILAVFGETARGIHLGLLCANLLSTLFVYGIGRRLFGVWAGCAAAAAFGLLAVSEGLQGPFANAEHFVLVPALGGTWLFLRAWDARGRGQRSLGALLASGVLLGAAFTIKQHGIVFPAAAWLLLAGRQLLPRPSKGARDSDPALGADPGSRASGIVDLALFTVALALPFGAVCLWMAASGVFERFWFWTFTYAREYAGERPFSDFVRNLRGKGRYVTRVAPLLYVLAGLGLTAVAWDRIGRRRRGVFAVFVLFSFLATTPGFHVRPHYFVLALPAAALAIGLFVSALGRLALPRGPAALALAGLPLVVGCGDYLWRQREYLFVYSPTLVSRQTYGGNPFPESLAVANFVAEATEPQDRVAILGSEPQIWFYAKRRAAAGYVYLYALMETHPFALEMQQDFIRQLEETEAEMLVLVRIGTSWLASERSHKAILQWMEQELRDYELVALMPVGIGARLLRGRALEALSPDRPKENVIEIYRRR